MFFATSASRHDDAGDSSMVSTPRFLAMDARSQSMEARIVVADSFHFENDVSSTAKAAPMTSSAS
eukprot:4315950-Pyramimonas_sp.AAC.1